MHQLDFYAFTAIEQQQRARQMRLNRTLLIREALAGQRGRISFTQAALFSMGKRIERFGAALQARYSQTDSVGHTGTLISESAC